MRETKHLASISAAPSASTVPGMSRRDALRAIGLSPIAGFSLAQTSAITVHASEAKGKIVIVGGGAAGIMTLSRLHQSLSTPDITIIAPNETHLYQQGQLFLATGIYTPEDIIKDNDNYIPSNVHWVKDTVKRFDSDHNRVITKKGKRITYDYLIVATGIIPYYERIKGLKRKDIGHHGIASVYLNDLKDATAKGAEMANKWSEEITEAARDTVPTLLFTQPSTPIKCESAPQQMLFLEADRLQKIDPTLRCEYVFATGRNGLSPLKPIADALLDTHKRYDTVTTALSHELVAIDVPKKIATFRVDKRTDDQSNGQSEVKRPYDFIHIVPPMGPPKAVSDSPLVEQEGPRQGWLDIDEATLQHRRYKNVFGIGDVCGFSGRMTASAVRYQAITLVKNLISIMEEGHLTQRYDGRTFCPIKTGSDRSIAAEYDRTRIIASLPFFEPLEPRWIWWASERYLHRPMYWQLILRGLA